MEAILVLIGVLAGLWFLVAPGIALASASGASARQRDLERRFAELEARLAGEAFRFEREARAAFPRPAPPPQQLSLALEPPADAVAAAAAARRAEALAELGAFTARAAAEREADAARQARAAAVSVESARHAEAPRAVDAEAPEPPPEDASAEADGRPATLEEQIGVTWLTRAGAAAFLLGALFFFKHAVEKEWIGPGGRVALGAAVGVGLLAAAEVIRKTARDRFVHALAGIGLAVLFVTVWASSAFYTLAPRPVAFVLSGALAILGAGLALRHKGQPILILALVAAFLNPVVLASDGDHGLELFLYLFVVTSVAEIVAMKLRFWAVSQLSIFGVAALFAGWYLDRGWLVDQKPLGLAVLAGFGASWCWAAARVARDPERRVEGAIRAAEALALVQIGATFVLQSPATLVLASIAIATASAIVSRRVGNKQLLAPLFVGAASFAWVIASEPGNAGAATLPLLGVWALVLVATALDFKATKRIDSAQTALAALPIAAFALVAAQLTAVNAPAIGVATQALVALAGAWLAGRAARPAVGLAFAVASGALVVAIATTLGGAAPTALLIATGLWTIATTLPALRGDAGASPREAPHALRHAGWEASLGAAIGAIGFAAVAILATRPEAEELRATLLGGAALSTLALAMHAFARHDDSDAAALFGGLALALGAAAIAFACQGATITVLWAVLAALAAVVARRTDRTAWQAIAGVLFAAAIGRAVFVDVAETIAATERFLATRGAEGLLAAPPFANARAVALAACAVALLVAARATWDMRARAPSRLAAIGGYGILLVTLAVEVRDITRALPALPAQPVGDAAWADFLARYDAATSSGHDARTMFTTLVVAAFAAALLAIGFGARSGFHRWLGLALFSITVAKLALWDVWHVGSVEQVVLLTGVGALLVAGGFLYARFGKRLVAMMQSNVTNATSPREEHA